MSTPNFRRFVTKLMAFCFLACSAYGQAMKEMEGKFYVAVDDSCVVLRNGKEIFTARYKPNQKVTTSELTTLAIGDHLVFKVHNKGGPRGLLVLFVNEDGKSILHFPKSSFKLLASPETTNFTDLEFRDSRAVKDVGNRNADKIFPYRSRSERVWGETATCAVGFIVTRDLISAPSP